MPDGVDWGVYAAVSLLSSIIPVLITNPLDVLKTRQQSRQRIPLATSAVELAAKEGLRGIQLGSAVSVTAYSISPCIKMCAYQAFASVGIESTPVKGALSGVATSVIASPIWVLKTRTMLTPNARLQDIVSDTLRAEGFRGFYTGLAPSCITKSIEFCVFFVVYEALKAVAADWAQQGLAQPASFGCGAIAHVVGSAGAARLVATLAAYPVQVVTTRVREPASWGGLRSSVAVAREMLAHRALYSGIAPHLLKAVPFTSLYFLGHEYLMSVYRAQPEHTSEG